MNKRVLIILILLMTIFLSCKQKERIIRKEVGKKLTEEELERRIFSDNKEIKTIKFGKINFSVDMNGEKFESGGTIAILKDSVIIVSLIPLMGYEVSRIFCFKDTIIVLDRLEKIFFYTSLERNINNNNISDRWNKMEISISYDQFKTVENFVFPQEIRVRVNSSKNNLDIKLNIG